MRSEPSEAYESLLEFLFINHPGHLQLPSTLLLNDSSPWQGCDQTIRQSQESATPNLVNELRIFGGVLTFKLRDGAGNCFRSRGPFGNHGIIR